MKIFKFLKFFQKKHAKYTVTVVLNSLVNVKLVLELKGYRLFVHPVMMDFILLIPPECKIAKPVTPPALLV
jgi:hypothetical protein